MRHDQFVAGGNASNLGGCSLDVFALVLCGHGLTATQEGVTAQCNDDTHRKVLIEALSNQVLREQWCSRRVGVMA